MYASLGLDELNKKDTFPDVGNPVISRRLGDRLVHTISNTSSVISLETWSPDIDNRLYLGRGFELFSMVYVSFPWRRQDNECQYTGSKVKSTYERIASWDGDQFRIRHPRSSRHLFSPTAVTIVQTNRPWSVEIGLEPGDWWHTLKQLVNSRREGFSTGLMTLDTNCILLWMEETWNHINVQLCAICLMGCRPVSNRWPRNLTKALATHCGCQCAIHLATTYPLRTGWIQFTTR